MKVELMAQKTEKNTVASLVLYLVDLMGETMDLLSVEGEDYLTAAKMVWIEVERMEVSKAFQMVE